MVPRHNWHVPKSCEHKQENSFFKPISTKQLKTSIKHDSDALSTLKSICFSLWKAPDNTVTAGGHVLTCLIIPADVK